MIALEDYAEALKYWHTALEIFREINARETEAYLLNNFAKFYQSLGQDEQAIEYCNQAINLATELNLPLLQECQLLHQKIANKTQ